MPAIKEKVSQYIRKPLIVPQVFPKTKFRGSCSTAVRAPLPNGAAIGVATGSTRVSRDSAVISAAWSVVPATAAGGISVGVRPCEWETTLNVTPRKTNRNTELPNRGAPRGGDFPPDPNHDGKYFRRQ